MTSFAHERARKLRAQENQQRAAELRRGNESGFRYDPDEVERSAARDAERYGDTPHATLDRYYEANQPLTGAAPALAKAERKERDLAKSFRYDPMQEAMLKLKDTDRDRYELFGPTEKISASMYERSKLAAKELGLPTGDPDGE